MSASQYYPLRVREVIDETHDAKSLVFDVPTELQERFAYRPGQFLTLHVPYEGRRLARCYSLCSAPDVDAAPRVTVKRVDDGRASNWICDHVQAGDELEILPPAGVFTPKNLDGEFLLFAGGSGITPVFSILKSVLARGEGRVHLLYANRDQESIIFRRELNALSAAHPQRLIVHHWLDSVQGMASPSQLAALIAPHCGEFAEAFICGPGPFMDCVAAALKSLQLPRKRIHIERFVSLSDDQLVPSAAESEGEGAELEVELDGEVHQLRCAPGETVLEAMLREGLDAPHSCRSGECAACMCQLEEGEAGLRRNAVLDEEELEEGWILACQAVPRAKKLKVSFDG